MHPYLANQETTATLQQVEALAAWLYWRDSDDSWPLWERADPHRHASYIRTARAGLALVLPVTRPPCDTSVTPRPDTE